MTQLFMKKKFPTSQSLSMYVQRLRACTVDKLPYRTNWATYLSRAGQIRLFLSFIKSYKIQTLTFLSADFRSQLSMFVCLAFVTKKYIPLFSLYHSITFNIAKTFTLCQGVYKKDGEDS